jgi:hypothetical protein
MANYQLLVQQDPDGTWACYLPDTSVPLAWDNGFATREQAERTAQRFMEFMTEREEMQNQIRDRMIHLAVQWTDELVGKSGHDRNDVMLHIRNGMDMALDYLAFPTG